MASKFDRVISGAKKAGDFVKSTYKKGEELAEKPNAKKAIEMASGIGGAMAIGGAEGKLLNAAKRAKWNKEAPINKERLVHEKNTKSYQTYKKEPSSISGVTKTTAGPNKGKTDWSSDSGTGGKEGNRAKTEMLRAKDKATSAKMAKEADEAGVSRQRVGGKKISNWKTNKNTKPRKELAKELKEYKNTKDWRGYVKFANKDKK